MTRRPELREELEQLRRDIEAIRAAKAEAGPAKPKPAKETEADGPFGELRQLVQTMLDDAEQSVAGHPLATVAGALALGIVIGRLTAR